MRIARDAALAFEALSLDKARAGLTVLGIAIGVAAVIGLVGLGEGARAAIAGQVEGLGAGLMVVMPGDPADRGGFAGRGTTAQTLTIADAEALARAPGVAVAAPTSVLMGVLEAGRAAAGAELIGTTTWLAGLQGYELAEGRFFTEAEARAGARVVVLGHRVAADLFGGATAPVGAKVQAGALRLRVVGVLRAQGGLSDADLSAILPQRAFRAGLRQDDHVDVVYARAASEAAVPAARAAVRRLLRQRHGLRPGAPDDFDVRTPADMLAAIGAVTRGFTVLLAGIAAVSLLVGGIGIMNVMLVSVTERTREIGVRMALGARRRDLLAQFLVEALALAGLGGAAGVLLGLAIAWIGARAAGLPFVASAPAVLGGFAFAAAVGVFFGLYPAARAARLDPVEALRYE